MGINNPMTSFCYFDTLLSPLKDITLKTKPKGKFFMILLSCIETKLTNELVKIKYYIYIFVGNMFFKKWNLLLSYVSTFEPLITRIKKTDVPSKYVVSKMTIKWKRFITQSIELFSNSWNCFLSTFMKQRVNFHNGENLQRGLIV